MIAVRLQRDFRAPITKLFEAWSNPAFLTTWWSNLESAKIDFREGGALELKWSGCDEVVTGTYRQIIDNQLIVFTWKGDPLREGFGETLVKLAFEERGDVTRVSLTHELNRTKSEADSHHSGWTKALSDFALEHARVMSPVTVGRTVPASPREVFDALTDGARMNQWFFTRCTTDPKPGGAYEIYWGSKTDPSRNHRRFGEYLEVVPHRRVRFSWRGLELDDKTTEVTIELSELDDGNTELTLSHDGWGDSDAWRDSRDKHESGWSFYVDNLAGFLADGTDLREAYFDQATAAQP